MENWASGKAKKILRNHVTALYRMLGIVWKRNAQRAFFLTFFNIGVIFYILRASEVQCDFSFFPPLPIDVANYREGEKLLQ